MWIPPEQVDPVLLHAPTRRQVAVFGAVCAADGRLSTMSTDRFNAETFQRFLTRLLRRRRPGRKLAVVVDNARWHHARHLTPWLRQHRDVVTLDFLPPYSPQLNAMVVHAQSVLRDLDRVDRCRRATVSCLGSPE